MSNPEAVWDRQVERLGNAVANVRNAHTRHVTARAILERAKCDLTRPSDQVPACAKAERLAAEQFQRELGHLYATVADGYDQLARAFGWDDV